MAQVYLKDPEAILDFAFDWSDWLATSETISTRTITVPSGLTQSSTDTESSGVVTVWLSGGTVGQIYDVECKIVTNASRTDERTMKIKVVER